MNALAEPLAAEAADAPATPTVMLAVADLRPNPWNRKKYDEAKFQHLVDSVRKIGLLQAIVVRPYAGAGAGAGQPSHEIVAGERRWRACQAAGLQQIPATVRTLTDLELIEALLVENTEREEMNALDEAECLKAMLRKPDGLHGYATVDELAERIGRKRSYVYQRIQLLTLCQEARDALLAGDITANHALRIARLANAKDQADTVKACVNGWGGQPMSVRDLDDYIHRTYMLDLSRAVFNIKSESLLPAAGSCTQCPKRSGNAPDLFEDIKKGDTCTDSTCYAAKETAHREQLRAKAEAEGRTVIAGADAKKAKPQQYGQLKGYLALDEVHHQIGSKPLRKLLGKHPLEVIAFEDPHTKALYDVVRETEALALLKERGVVKQAKMPTSSASQRQAEAKARAEKAWRAAVAEACVTAAAGAVEPYTTRLVWLAAELLWREMQHDTCERVGKLMGWPPLPRSWQAGTGKTLAEHFSSLSAEQLKQYFTATAIAGDMAVNAYNTGHTGKPERLLGIAEALAVDVAGIKEQLRREQLARVPGKAAADDKAKKNAKAKGQPEQTPETALAAAVKKAQANGKPAAGRRTELPRTVKYRCPDTGSTWSGRGLQPAWVKAALAEGKTLASLQVQPEKAAPKAHISAAAADVMGQAA